MGALYYFIPNAGSGGALQELIGKLGLRHAFPRGARLPKRAIANGPGVREGLLLSTGAGEVAYRTDMIGQDFGDWWVGYDPNDPVKPTDIERDGEIEHHGVRLRDGNIWKIPVVRKFPYGWAVADDQQRSGHTTALPLVLGIDAKGNTIHRVGREYTELWALCAKARADLFEGDAGDDKSFTFDDSLRLGALALSVGYRVSIREVSLLELIDTANALEIIKTLLDWPTYEALRDQEQEKKSAGSDGRDSAAGAGGSPDTCRAGEKSSSTTN